MLIGKTRGQGLSPGGSPSIRGPRARKEPEEGAARVKTGECCDAGEPEKDVIQGRMIRCVSHC